MNRICIVSFAFFILRQIAFAQPCPSRPNAALRLNNNDICGDAPVMVTNISSENGNSVYYVWDWGDGMKDTVQDQSTPVHQYRERGDLCAQSNDGQAYTLTLTIVNRRTGCPGHQAQTTIYAYARPRADFNAPPEICIDNPVAYFTNTTCPRTTPNTTFSWNFGDPLSNDNTSTLENPQHRYSRLGSYEVTLTVNSLCGSTTFKRTIVVREAPIVGVTYTPPALTCGPFDIAFQNNSTGQWGNKWKVTNMAGDSLTEGFSFVNGSNLYSTNPTIRFDKKGTYLVKLTITSPCGDKNWTSQPINVLTPPIIAIDSMPTGCIPFTAQPRGRLLDDGGAGTPQYAWQFSGGTPNTSTSLTPPDINYSTAGSYILVLKATNNCGTNEATYTLNLSDKIRPVFPNIKTKFCDTDTATYRFQAQPVGGTWSGSAISADGVFRPSIVGAGSYSVKYSIQQGTCRGDSTVVLTVGGSAVSGGATQEICGTSNTVILRGQNPIGGTWRGLGIIDSTTGAFNPALTGLGSFDVVYTFGSGAGCSNSATKTVVVKPTPIARFDTFPSALCVNLAQNFKHKSTNGVRFNWQFGNLATSTLENPNYAFTQTGNFDVKLFVTNRENCTDSVSKNITVNAPPTARFSPSVTEGCSPLDVSFTNNSTNSTQTSFLWDFGNGTTSTVRTPNIQTFNNASLQDTFYKIRLAATTLGCPAVYDSTRLTIFIVPKARFGVDADTGCSPMTVRFNNISTGSPRSFQWNFGNGRTATSEIVAPQVYQADSIARSYSIRLTVTNTCGTDSFERKITVRPSATRPFFSLSRTEGCAPLSISLTNYAATNATVTYDFGDGNRYTNPNPTYTYEQAGTYTITQYASGVCGFDSTKRTVTVFPTPSVKFSFTQSNACKERKITFKSLINPQTVYLTWDFGDSTQSGASNPIHDYRKAGFYRVILSATSQANGCRAADTSTIEVIAPLAFTVDSIKNATCYGISDGAIVIRQGSVTGGARIYEFSLDDSTFQKINRAGVFSNLKGRQFYTIWVRDSAGCTDSSKVYVGGLLPLSIDAGSDHTIDLGDSVQIFVTANRATSLKIKWSPNRGLTCDTCATVWAKPFETTEYVINATDPNGCIERTTTLVTVNKNIKVFVPTAFSPNDDGVNDHFAPFIGSNISKINYFRVYDRWGTLLYHAENFAPNDPDIGWDGRIRGSRALTGVYVYIMELTLINGQVEKFDGDVSLVR
ncbi:MAG: PKD domain-containing protein [Saprospiraceae bacterium]|nr:PKD domain-containing protein [Saprospiraceae bacterium]